jgi:hypothetical protein
MRCLASLVFSATFEAPGRLPWKNVLAEEAQPSLDKTQQRQYHLLCSQGAQLSGLRLADASIRCCYCTTSSPCRLKISPSVSSPCCWMQGRVAEARTISFFGTRGMGVLDLRSRRHRPAVMLRAPHRHPQRHQMSLSEPSYAWWVFTNPTCSKLLRLIFVAMVGMYPVPAAVRHCTAEYGHPSRGRLAARPSRPVCCAWRSTSMRIPSKDASHTVLAR